MYNEIKSIKEPTEEDCYLGIIRAYQREVGNLQQENKQLKEELQEANDNIIWWSNRFKAVERDNKQLKSILTELEEWLENNWKSTQDIWYVKIINKIQELKEKYK